MTQVRCAIYTRKSTEEGLDQSFNSLDAQREACEAYIRSQAGEGWKLLPTRYDDGGYSGGNLNRPAMQQLIADIDAGKVDVIVVYKVDRLTRSLMDFAKIVERLDARGISFVSVTQAFNTTSSMGRLTLNVLLSFAQFEREVTGERIRDKIAASKAKGMWMGGTVPLGFDLHERRLFVNASEAEQVRHIFTRYLALGSGVKLAHELRRDGVVSKRWMSRSSRTRGGVPFDCGALYYLLQNRIYLGKIVHRGVSHDGEHEPIVSEELCDAVQQALAQNRRKRREHPKRSASCLLAGLVRDADGQPMTTSFSYGRGGRRYRYYVSGSLNPSRRPEAKPPRRVPAAALERLVLQSLTGILQPEITLADALPLISAVELHHRSVQIVFKPESLLEPFEPLGRAVARLQPLTEPHRLVADSNRLRLIFDRKPVFRGGRARGIDIPRSAGPIVDGASLLKSAHRLLESHAMSPLDPSAHAQATAPAWQRQRRIMALGLLAPQLQKKMLQGSYAGALNAMMAAAPLAWADQISLINAMR
ncbi:MAG TPA: recombinase family protein [Sphingomicrobium sp.]|jgi:site-specific DNA recombinase|nr:recombinase family protein [Sphingomicrobium sp.]